MYQFWYDYINPKYGDRAKLCYTDTDSFVIYIKTEDSFEDISNDVEKWFDTSNYNKKVKTHLTIGKNKKVGPFKGTKRCLIKLKIMLQNFKSCLLQNKTVYRSQQRFKSYNHNVYTEDINKIALKSNDDERLQKFDRITTYPYEANDSKVCESERLTVKNLFFEKLQWYSVTTINIKTDQLWWLR